MSLYPVTVKRCQQIKVNGTQCGSPALRDAKHCYYHVRYHWPELDTLPDNNEWLQTSADAGGCEFHTSGAGQRDRTSDNAGNRSQDGSTDVICAADSVHELETNLAGTGTADAGSD